MQSSWELEKEKKNEFWGGEVVCNLHRRRLFVKAGEMWVMLGLG